MYAKQKKRPANTINAELQNSEFLLLATANMQSCQLQPPCAAATATSGLDG
jgi:hypothetical protein